MNTIREIFSSTLRRLRADRTQSEIAEAAEMPLRAYQRYEAGALPVNKPEHQVALVKALGVPSIEHLFAPPAPPTVESLTGIIESQERRIRELEAAVIIKGGAELPADLAALIPYVEDWDFIRKAFAAATPTAPASLKAKLKV